MPDKLNYERTLLLRTNRALNSTENLDQVLITVLEEVRRALEVTACSIWLLEPPDAGETALVCRQAAGPQAELVRGQRLQPGEGIAGWVVQTGESVVLADAQADERHCKAVDHQTGLCLHSMLSVPLRAKEKVIGVLQVLDRTVDRFGPRDQILLASLAASAAIVVDNARLVEKLRARTAELEARNEELDAFAQTVAHDLKNPLALTIGFAEVLDQDLPTLSEQEARQCLERIIGNGRKMQEIIDALLLLTSTDQRQAVEIGPLNMQEILNQTQRRLERLIEERQAEIILPETWPVALGYGPWIEEVWVNYLSNAIKYGGQPPQVKIGFKTGAPLREPDSPLLQRIALESGTSLSWVQFCLQDNGEGLTPEEQEQLFQPFSKLSRDNGGGHGLGLSIVQRIVEKLGGDVEVASQKGQGSTFCFTLPGLANSKAECDGQPFSVPAPPAADGTFRGCQGVHREQFSSDTIKSWR